MSSTTEDDSGPDLLYIATTDVVKAVKVLSDHCHNPIEKNSSFSYALYESLLKNDVVQITKVVKTLYLEIERAEQLIKNTSHGQVKCFKMLNEDYVN